MEGYDDNDEFDLDGINLENLDFGGNRDDLDAELTVKGVGKCLQKVKTFSKTQQTYFLVSPFGQFLDVPPPDGDAILMHDMMLREVRGDKELRIRFEVDGHLLEYGESEFILITGLRVGEYFDILKEKKYRGNCMFRARVFPRISDKKLRLNDFSNLIHSASFKEINDSDASLVVQNFILLRGFMSRDLCTCIPPSVLTLVDDINSWNIFAWGTYLWEYTYVQMSNIFKKIADYAKDFYDMCADKGLKYTVVGFMFPFKIWIWETFPIIRQGYVEYKGDDVLPRMKAWRRKRKIVWIHIKDILNISLVMIPRQNELNTDYYSRYIRWKEGNRSPQMQQPSQESEQEKAYDEEPLKKNGEMKNLHLQQLCEVSDHRNDSNEESIIKFTTSQKKNQDLGFEKMDPNFFDGIDENLGMPPSEDNNAEREIPESTPAGPRYPQRIRQPAAILLSPNTTYPTASSSSTTIFEPSYLQCIFS
ncbi:hypothetical protein LXL04_014827 [Taraxacum kok-saghyz]